jgi:hypothetical protein
MSTIHPNTAKDRTASRSARGALGRSPRRRTAGWVAALFLLAAAAGCGDRTLAFVEPEDPRLAVARASVARAQELYALALRADSAGQLYRPLLLRALVDGLQFGAPMQNIPIRIGSTNLTFTAIAQDAVMTSAGTPAAAAGMLLAWRGANAEQIVVIVNPYGAGVDPAAFNTIAFYLDSDDMPRMATGGTADFRLDPPGLVCVYQQATPLVGPPGECVEERVAAALNLTVHENGDLSTAPQSLQLSRTNLNGVRITRRAEDFAAVAALLRLRPR